MFSHVREFRHDRRICSSVACGDDDDDTVDQAKAPKSLTFVEEHDEVITFTGDASVAEFRRTYDGYSSRWPARPHVVSRATAGVSRDLWLAREDFPRRLAVSRDHPILIPSDFYFVTGDV